MSVLQEMEQSINEYQNIIRTARIQNGMTISELAEKSGVPASTVSKICAGNQSAPNLYNSAALCKTLGLSIDEIFGLKAPDGSQADLQERNHKLELENACLTATNDAQKAQIKSAHSICYVLVFFCALLAMSLVVYLVIDLQITDAGIIRSGELSGTAWAFVGLIVASIIAAGATISRIIKKESAHDKKGSNK